MTQRRIRIYVASSWRNLHQPEVVRLLGGAGYAVYDFRNPGDGEKGFGWDQVDPNWKQWSVHEFGRALRHPVAAHAFERDQRALEWCDCCVLVLPAGSSAHLEAGWCSGRGKPVIVYAPELKEPELMYRLLDQSDETPLHQDFGGVLKALVAADDNLQRGQSA